MAEQPYHVAVFAVQLELHLRLVLLQVLRAHPASSCQSSTPSDSVAASTCAPLSTGASSVTSKPSRSPSSPSSPSSAEAAPNPALSSSGGPKSAASSDSPIVGRRQDSRWCSHGPTRTSASRCSGAAYPLLSCQLYAVWSPARATIIMSRSTFASTLAAATDEHFMSALIIVVTGGVPGPSPANAKSPTSWGAV